MCALSQRKEGVMVCVPYGRGRDGVIVFVLYSQVRMYNHSLVLSKVMFILILGAKSLSFRK